MRKAIRDHRRVIPILVRWFQRFGLEGGPLHVQLSDGNMADRFFWSAALADGTYGRVARVLLLCSGTQRTKAAKKARAIAGDRSAWTIAGKRSSRHKKS